MTTTGVPTGTMNNWMSALPDSLSLSDISIPGTHDSSSFLASLLNPDIWITGGIASLAFTQCQSADFPTQLNMGIAFSISG